MPTCDDVLTEARRLVEVGRDQHLTIRLLGGVAIRLHCPSATHQTLTRAYADIDLVVPARDGARVEPFLMGEGYTPNKTFNTLSGERRRLYYDPAHNRQLDVFIGAFEMCHKLPIAERLQLEPLTVPLAELFLSKAQIVMLNAKDALDLVALLLDHPVAAGDDETINAGIVAELCARDWGLYTTITINVGKLANLLSEGSIDLGEAQKQVVRERLATLQQVVEGEPKTLAWKMRARVGTRVRWYEEVEEVHR